MDFRDQLYDQYIFHHWNNLDQVQGMQANLFFLHLPTWIQLLNSLINNLKVPWFGDLVPNPSTTIIIFLIKRK
jgi:hypothetical protein